MKTILQLNTGLFPDAETVEEAIATREGHDQIIRLDVSNPQPGDRAVWDAAAAAILSAGLVVTL